MIISQSRTKKICGSQFLYENIFAKYEIGNSNFKLISLRYAKIHNNIAIATRLHKLASKKSRQPVSFVQPYVIRNIFLLNTALYAAQLKDVDST